MKFFLSIFSAALLMGHAVEKSPSTSFSRWVVESSSSLNIQGSSNVNTFTCVVAEYLKPDTLAYSLDEKSNKLSFNNSSLSIDINRFDCHQKYITADLRKTLKADENPVLKIRFLNIDNVDGRNSNSKINGNIDIVLAGVVKRVNVDFMVGRPGKDRITLTGDKELLFSDFALTPPRKLAGLIRINEKITVHFHLELKVI